MAAKKKWIEGAGLLPRLVRLFFPLPEEDDPKAIARRRFYVERMERLQELGRVMDFWHAEQLQALYKMEEARDCGNPAREAFWRRRLEEAKVRCDKDYRVPMMLLTEDTNLFQEVDDE